VVENCYLPTLIYRGVNPVSFPNFWPKSGTRIEVLRFLVFGNLNREPGPGYRPVNWFLIYFFFNRFNIYIIYSPGSGFPIITGCQKLGPEQGSPVFGFLQPEPESTPQFPGFPIPVPR
jgi:hypothetical protein